MNALLELINPVTGTLVVLGFAIGSTIRTAHNLGRHHR